MHDTVVYLGPTLSRSEAASILPAHYLPPICRGDLAKLPETTKIIGIVDGEFCQNLAVSSKEIVALLGRGTTIFGAASMGALRAAETCRFGTIGVGEIFAMFRDRVLDADDEVALVYDPQSYRPLSEPLVNIRRALKMAFEGRAIDQGEMDRLLLLMQSYYFPDRSYSALKALCPAFAAFFRDSVLPDVKRDDARKLLFEIRNMQQNPASI